MRARAHTLQADRRVRGYEDWGELSEAAILALPRLRHAPRSANEWQPDNQTELHTPCSRSSEITLRASPVCLPTSLSLDTQAGVFPPL